MRPDIDAGKVLYAVGALFGIAAVLYFARDIVFDLSITVRAVLLLIAFVVMLTAALTSSKPGIATVLFVLSAAAYVAFLGYTLSRFDVGADGTFVSLLLSAGLFFGLGYLMRERELSPSRRTVQYVVGAVVLIGVVFVGADMALSGVEYDVSVNDEGQIGDGGRVEIGTATAENEFVFREPVDMPRPLVCSYGVERRERPVDLRVGDDRVPDTVPGGGTVTATVFTRFTDEEVQDVDDPVPIEVADTCPEAVDDARIVVVPGDEFPEPPR